MLAYSLFFCFLLFQLSLPLVFLLVFTLFRLLFFFFNDTATTEIYTLSLHDALPIYAGPADHDVRHAERFGVAVCIRDLRPHAVVAVARDLPAVQPVSVEEDHRDFRAFRSEEHTSELQSRLHLVCRLLLEKKKKNNNIGMIKEENEVLSGVKTVDTIEVAFEVNEIL